MLDIQNLTWEGEQTFYLLQSKGIDPMGKLAMLISKLLLDADMEDVLYADYPDYAIDFESIFFLLAQIKDKAQGLEEMFNRLRLEYAHDIKYAPTAGGDNQDFSDPLRNLHWGNKDLNGQLYELALRPLEVYAEILRRHIIDLSEPSFPEGAKFRRIEQSIDDASSLAGELIRHIRNFMEVSSEIERWVYVHGNPDKVSAIEHVAFVHRGIPELHEDQCPPQNP